MKTRRRVVGGAVVVAVVVITFIVAFSDRSGDDVVSRQAVAHPVLPYERPTPPDGVEPFIVNGAWRLVRVDDDDRHLIVRVATGQCQHLVDMAVVESGDSLHLTARVDQWANPCRDALHVNAFRLRLPTTVDGRRLTGQCRIDASTSAGRLCEDLARRGGDADHIHDALSEHVWLAQSSTEPTFAPVGATWAAVLTDAPSGRVMVVVAEAGASISDRLSATTPSPIDDRLPPDVGDVNGDGRDDFTIRLLDGATVVATDQGGQWRLVS